MWKKVRVRNSTSDVELLRVHIAHFDPAIRYVANVVKGTYSQNNHMTPGNRGVLVYEDFNETIIGTNQFYLDANGFNVEVVVSGDQSSGYLVSFASWS